MNLHNSGEVTVLASLLIGFGGGMLSVLSMEMHAGHNPITWQTLGASPEAQGVIGLLTLTVGVVGLWQANRLEARVPSQ